mmetsp:Transcript_96355/g.162110  ORF Transcript_96355/g.162110 Transcript_96355/m.162110 type:complete len:205 (-) Transcript_96355:356-970(-)
MPPYDAHIATQKGPQPTVLFSIPEVRSFGVVPPGTGFVHGLRSACVLLLTRVIARQLCIGLGCPLSSRWAPFGFSICCVPLSAICLVTEPAKRCHHDGHLTVLRHHLVNWVSMVAEEKPLLNHWVHDPLGMFETSLDPRLLRWVPRPDTCEGPVCITVAEDVVAWTAWAYERAHGRGHWVLGTRADCCLLNRRRCLSCCRLLRR